VERTSHYPFQRSPLTTPQAYSISRSMSSPRTHPSDEEWCLLSDSDGNDRSSVGSDGDDEVEAEPELVPRYTSAASTLTKLTLVDEADDSGAASSLESTQVMSLLSDTLPAKELDERREAAYSRAVRLSLLSTHHRDRIQGISVQTKVAECDTLTRGCSSVKVAFGLSTASATTKRAFPDRLRETVVAFRAAGAEREACTPTFTPVNAFVRDQATQSDASAWEQVGSTAPAVDISRVGLFRAALDRTFALSAQLHAKNQECEQLSLRVMKLEQRQADTERCEEDGGQLESCQRSLAIANERLALGLEYQDRLRGKVADLTDENASLKRQNIVLSGQENDLSDESVLKLEALEDALAAAMDNLRAALRTKYRSAIHKVQTIDTQTGDEESERCVVCLTQAATVKTTPCGHRVLCPGCAVRLDTCPVDRLPIKDKVLTFGLIAYSSG
jgi:hypothetical protein